MKSLGCNMKGIYYPNIRMGQALKESRGIGLSRIEITYTLGSKDLENDMLNPLFRHEAENDLGKVQLALSRVKGICWHIPLSDLLNAFVEGTRKNQLLIVQQTSAAMIYAANSKSGCFTGFYQNGHRDRKFNYIDLI